MRNRTYIYIGVGIIVIGLISLLDTVTDIDLARFLCPTILILLGVWFLIRPRLIGPDTAFDVKLLGDIRRRGTWQLAEEEIWSLVGDVRLDLTEAAIPAGETTIRILGVVGSVRITVPEGVGFALECTSIATDAKVFGRRHDRAFSPYHYVSDGYDGAERQVRVEISRIVADVKVRRATTNAADVTT
jgi:lia operon protein LiaF